MAVEAGVVAGECGTRREPEAQPVADAVRVGAQWQITRERMDSLRSQVGIAGEPPGRQ